MVRLPKHSSIALTIVGFIFILFGLIGALIIYQSPSFEFTKGNFRFFEKNLESKSLEIVTSFTQPITLLPNINGSSLEPIQMVLQPFKTFIHSTNIELENPAIPDKIEIPSIKLFAPVVVSDFNFTKVEDETFGQWIAPSKFAAGWQPNSALLGDKGNTVINGHHNEFGEVFGKLVDVELGDIIIVSSGEKSVKYIVSNKMILAERFQTAEVRLDNARWLEKTDDIRLTLVTCYPKESNTHRLIIVARLLAD